MINYKRKVIFSHHLKNTVISIEAAICPYCNCTLKKIPQHKTKCYNCNNMIFVRTNAYGERFAVTESQKDEIDRFKKSVKNRIGCGCVSIPGCILPIINTFFVILLLFFLVIIF